MPATPGPTDLALCGPGGRIQTQIDLGPPFEQEAEPADVFINKKRFPWMTEYYPWPVVCDDSFSTIQNQAGCVAKHNKVEIIDQDE